MFFYDLKKITNGIKVLSFFSSIAVKKFLKADKKEVFIEKRMHEMRNINRGNTKVNTYKTTTTQKSLLKKKVVEAKEKEEDSNKSRMRPAEINCSKHPAQLSKKCSACFR